ncbi:dihydrolipoyl dehydrogenase [Afifella marina]|uniref:Dihydrolipoyl dehydrogenase n=1 Tax=Afifella marina DSM 2698 TaxID=1120955 RepID=A0A1G5NNC2_AFIMA|nr:dihydrolipoyl dehydrogenase [Afifella marina]MBK1624638.1 dihydrolipoyl dehydrogenase [Afifella marina DSM 2698]MBK1627531.1 dihydrolipoyl dehydrogenase [Afifella marina]MBK5918589.1 dihydrolipoyl dehydrogenase [Afifella marina]RAI18511.1 dihydrolipoyl dehydrogenase [Afifella marina DSM 2698]SCZ38644.1 dihydrolipoamide dehydrogenase [Afifella marina DSM 2698]
MPDTYDLIVIGSGPGGYVCAIRAAQLGLKTAVVEKRPTFGGTCLNVGCIPSKALLHTSEMFEQAAHGFADFGIKVKPELDLEAMLAHKDKTVKANVDGVAYLFKKNKIDTFEGVGRIVQAGEVEVRPEKGEATRLSTKAIVIATGSESAPLPGVEVDEKKIVSSTGALKLGKVPEKLVVVGAGIIGLELGSVWRRLGAKVTVVEFLDRILPGMDGEVAKQAQRLFKKQGIDFRLGTKVTGVETEKKGLRVSVEPVKGGDAEKLDADIVLVAIGRRPYTAGLGLEEAGVALDERGRVATAKDYKTNVEGIYAIGDAIAGPMLAHKAEDEGTAVAEILAGQKGHVNYEVIPSVVYTEPEIAVVGRSEEDLKEAGIAYRSGKFPFSANGRARAMNATDGFVKVLADEKTDQVLGVHIVGRGAGEMIHEAAVLMEFSGAAEDLARTCHAHPTMSEAVREAAMAAWFKPIHI